jgi:chitodextrinase
MFATLLGTVSQAEAQGANLALNQPTTQSSVDFGGAPALAVDGNTDGTYQNGSVTHTLVEQDAWWQVDLGASQSVGTVNLFNRTDCCADRLANFYVFVSATDLTGRSLTDIVSDASVARNHFTATVGASTAISISATGRFVRVQKVGSGVLSLAEVQVLAPGNGDAFVVNPGDQRNSVGDSIRLPISYGGSIDVVGLPNGWSFTNNEIVGTASVVGRWPIELRVSGANGSDIAFFQWIVTDGAPGGVVAEHPPIDPRTLNMRPIEGDGVVWDRFNDDTTTSLDITVWDMQQLGDWMYVGGEFKQVIESNGTTHNQAHLARFSIRTGRWDPSFRPQLDGNVHAMEVSPRGRLIVGGEFTNINGLPATEGLAAFNQAGQVDPTFESWVERPWYPEGRAIVRELEVVGSFLYIGGNFSHINGPGGTRVRVNKLTRVGANYGTIDPSWNPVVSGGSVWGIGVDQDRGRVYISGRFQAVNGDVVGTTATVDTITGDSVTGLTPHIRNAPTRPEMYDIEYAGNALWQAGSQHVLQLHDADTHDLIAWNHAGNRCDAYCWSSAGMGGDFQFVEKIGDFVYSGCHCNDKTPTTHYSSRTGQRSSHTVSMAYHLDGALVSEVEFDLGGNVDGGWSVASDDVGCLWLGGDIIDGGFYEPGGRVFARGFARFCDTDLVVPQNLEVVAELASGIRLEWDGIDNASGYAIYRDGLYLGFSSDPFYVDTEVVEGRTYEYYVRSENFQGTRSDESATVQALVGQADNEPPSVPENLAVLSIGGTEVDFEWDASTDNLGVKEYLIFRDGAYLDFVDGTETTYTDTGLENFARHSYEVRAVDFNDNRSDKSLPLELRVGGVDVDAPSIPQNLVVASTTPSSITIEWDASTDNVDVDQYLIYRDGQYHDFVLAGETSYTDSGLDSFAEHRYRIRAVDAADNRSDDSEVLVAQVGGIDDEAPSVPQNVAAVNVTDSSVDLVWDPSVDNIGVTSYLVYRDGAYIGWSPTASFTDLGLERGGYSYTVRALDGSENRSERSAALDVQIGGDDVQAPSVPVNVAAVNVTDSSVDLVWDPSVDDFGVSSYLIYRDGAYIGWSPTASFTDLGLSAGSYSYAVRAVDGADNRSERSAELDVQVGGIDNEAPSVPQNVSASVAGADVTISWADSVDNVGVTSYLIYRDGAYIGWSQTASFTDLNLATGVYSYAVRAVDAVDNRSDRSDGLSVQVGAADAEAPSTPANLAASVVGSDVSLSWTDSVDNVGVTGYLIYRDGAYIGWSPVASYTDSGVSDGTYAYAVRAVDAVDNRSERSDNISVLVGPEDVIAPSVPQNVAASNVTASSVELVWTASFDNVAVRNYLVYRDGAYIGWTNGTSYLDEGLVAGQTYQYTVRAVDTSELRSDASFAVSVTPA